MKNFLMLFFTFISPILPLAFLVLLVSISETFVFAWYSKKMADKIKIKKGVIYLLKKIIAYSLVLISSFLIDRFIINEIMAKYIWFDYAISKFFTSLLIWLEYQSIDKKIKSINGRGLTDKMVDFGNAIKKVIFFIKDINPKN